MPSFFTKKIFSFTFLFLFSVLLFLPTSTRAVICVYEGLNPNDLPMCHPVASDAECNAFCNVLGRPCGADSVTRSCDAFLAGQRANQQRQAEVREGERQREAAELQMLIERDPTIIDTANKQGQCLCSIGDSQAPLTALDGLSIDKCYDRNDSVDALDYQDARDDQANGALFNCRWEYNKNIDDTLNKNVDDLEKNDNFKPLQNYESSLADLNKLRATSLQGFLGGAIKTATGILGTIALAMMIYGGFLWLTSAGNSSQVEKAQNVIFYGALGIFVIFGSYALVAFIFEAVNPVNTTVVGQ